MISESDEVRVEAHDFLLYVQGVSAIRLFPRSAHLLLSCSMDCKIKVGHPDMKQKLLMNLLI